MARPRLSDSFTISQLQSILESRQVEIDALQRDRLKLAKQLGAIDEKIRKLGGISRGGNPATSNLFTASGRVRNAKSLVGSMAEVLAKSDKPMPVAEIVKAVESNGYKSNSANFRAIVNQTLIKERKHFVNAGRGLYELKK